LHKIGKPPPRRIKLLSGREGVMKGKLILGIMVSLLLGFVPISCSEMAVTKG